LTISRQNFYRNEIGRAKNVVLFFLFSLWIIGAALSEQSRHRNILSAIGITANITQRLFVANISWGDDFNSGQKKCLFSRHDGLRPLRWTD
jgi:hypothetical protein